MPKYDYQMKEVNKEATNAPADKNLMRETLNRTFYTQSGEAEVYDKVEDLESPDEEEDPNSVVSIKRRLRA